MLAALLIKCKSTVSKRSMENAPNPLKKESNMKDQTPFIELQSTKGNAKVIVLTVGADNPSPFKPHHRSVCARRNLCNH